VPDPLSTQALIEQVQQGDDEALQELCRRYQRRVLAAVRLRLGAALRTKMESWDLVQEVLIDALRHVRTFEFRTEGAFLHYLNRVASNKIRDEADRWHAQRRDMRREIPLENPRSAGSESPLFSAEDRAAPTPSKIVGLQEDLTALEHAMDRLPEEQRELIVAVKIEGRTYRELAEETGGTEDAVRMRVKRALLALTRTYKDSEGEASR